MTFQVITGEGLHFPQPINDAAPSLKSILLDAASEKAAFVFRVGKTGTVSKVGFCTATVTTGATVDVRLETVDLTNGNPTGTLLGTNSNGSQVIADIDDNTWFTVSLTTAVAVTRGDLVAVVIVNPSGSPGNLNIRAVEYNRLIFPYSVIFTTVWAKQATDRNPTCSLEYDDGSYAVHPGVVPIKTRTTRSFGSSSTPDERGLIFQFPFPVRVAGAWAYLDADEAVDIVLYDSDGTTALQTISLDKDVRAANLVATQIYPFDTTSELSANTNYRLVIKPTTTTFIRVMDFTIDTAAIMDSFEGGQNFHHTERTNAGSWTETTTLRPMMGLLLDAFDDGAGGAASILSGGFGL